VLEKIAAGEIHLTGVLMLGPHLTEQNHLQVLARARARLDRTKSDRTRLWSRRVWSNGRTRRSAPINRTQNRASLRLKGRRGTRFQASKGTRGSRAGA
jgi:hypothetical protein